MKAVSRWLTMVWTGLALIFVGLSMLMNRAKVTPAQRKNYQEMLSTWRSKFGPQGQS